MISVTLRVRQSMLTSFQAEGHAVKGPEGSSIVCSAVTSLLRTAARCVGSKPGISWSGEAAAPGEMSCRIEYCSADAEEWLMGVTDMLLRGLSDLAEENPDEVRLIITK
ncbi:MAG: ribosomal-processing cysteine protease Prp [Spirochaetales bacterium]|nr:MAG: ribosomal-processing cysteine protease Prp [Spirochaetales bacterium]